jgi:predicted Rossmann-fold nucleotide-binding protein
MTAQLRRRVVDVATLDEFDGAMVGARTLAGWRVRHLDLTGRTDALLATDPAGSLFLGCRMTSAALVHLGAGGALVYPDVPDAPVDEYRATTYTPDELYAGLDDGYQTTTDALVYAWSQRAGTVGATDSGALTARALHDASMVAALDAEIAAAGRRVVGVMGGHALARGDAAYDDAARLGRLLDRAGLTVATGGGPGAMEAANLGAYLADHDDAVLAEATELLSAEPSFRPSVDAWALAAREVRRRWPGGRPSLGVPTWFYGHEPPNLFASHVAKFFQNAVREAVLLERCTGGIVFLPGAAGTVQEIFQDACENYYADDAQVAPMVLVGRRHFSETVPAWPLLRALAAGRGFARAIALVDTVDEAARFVAEWTSGSSPAAARGTVRS